MGRSESSPYTVRPSHTGEEWGGGRGHRSRDCAARDCLSNYHLLTHRMGASDQPGAVVDGTGRVHGVSALRVVDASIFPTIPNGNLNAPTIMVAEKLADAILNRALPPDEAAAAAVWADPQWRSRQRERAPQRRVWDGVF